MQIKMRSFLENPEYQDRCAILELESIHPHLASDGRASLL